MMANLFKKTYHAYIFDLKFPCKRNILIYCCFYFKFPEVKVKGLLCLIVRGGGGGVWGSNKMHQQENGGGGGVFTSLSYNN